MNKYLSYLFIVLAFIFLSVNSTIEATGSIPSFYYKVDATISNVKPKLYEPVTISCKITSDRDIDKASIVLRFDGVEVVRDIKPIGFYAEEIQIKRDIRYYGEKGLIFNIKKGEIKEFSAIVKFIKKPSIYNSINVGFSVRSSDRINGWGVGAWVINYVCVDPVTGLLGNRDDWEKSKNIAVDKNSIICHYDYIAGVFTKEALVGYSGENKKIIALLKEMEPSITDSEALCLHADNYKLIINAIGDPNATDEERIKKLLSAGWLKAIRSGNRENWNKEMHRKMIKVGQKERGKEYFFALKGMAIPVGLILLVFLVMLKFGIKKQKT